MRWDIKMSKYTIYSTREDWEKLYKAVEKAGIDVKPFKKSQSYDGACVMYAEETGDYSLRKEVPLILEIFLRGILHPASDKGA